MKKYRYLILAAVLAVFIGAVILFWKPLSALASNPEAMRDWLLGKGILAPLVFAILNILQVIFAVIPGAPFEIAAGYLFGVLPGAVFCDATMTIGSVLVFLLVRRYGMRFVELFIPRKKIEEMGFLKDTQKVQSVLFFIFLIPATPKDVVTYLAGLTGLSLKSWIFICFVGRFPAVLLTALSGSALGASRYGIVAAVILVFAAAYLLGLRWYGKWKKKGTDEAR